MGGRGISRRRFVGQVASLGAVSAGLPGLALAEPAPPPKIVARTLGRTGLELPVVSFGVMNSDSPDLLRKALDLGVRHFDTAHGYLRGNSERVIGQILEERRARAEVVIGTKVKFARDEGVGVYTVSDSARDPGATEANLFKQLEESLERLRTDHVDILYLHSCYSAEMTTFEPLLEALVKARQAGKTRFVGVSTHRSEPAVIRAVADSGVHDVVLTAYNFLQDHRQEVKAAMEYAAGKGIGIVAMKTQGGRRLNSGVEVNHRAALKWVLADPNVTTTIPGVTTFEQLSLDVSVMGDLSLTEDERRELKLASLVPAPLYCQGCRTCVASCPRDVEIPRLMRAYMYAAGYGNSDQAAATLAGADPHRGLASCESCASCSAACVKGIPIGARVAALQRMALLPC